MPKFASERRVDHSAEEMFALVADCEAYPRFLPLCANLVVTGRGEEDGREILIADMTVAYGFVRETFTTRDVLDREALTIDVSYLNGPFRHFDSRWTFVPEGPGACLVRFEIDYEFRSRILAAVMGAAFDAMFRKFVVAFEARADKVYGTRAATA
ncbi:MAG: SRPBCC family protein [Bauldia sp.]|nr:SRPBCC family protein [Bauldia sp.]